MPGFWPSTGCPFFVEVKGQPPFLFDTGQSDSLIWNAGQIGVSLKDVDTVILSHSHYDHTGGLIPFVKKTKPKEVLVPRDFFDPKYKVNGIKREFIGNSFSKEELASQVERVTGVLDDLYELRPGVFVATNIPAVTPYEGISEPFFILKNGALVRDDFRSELVVVIMTPEGLLVMCGCAHAGIVNIVRHVSRLTGISRIRAVLGGTHLVHASRARIQNTAIDLKTAGVESIGVSHCTGQQAERQLAKVYGDRFFSNNTGTMVEFDL
ncbi:MAG TPA: MBL fold metallo-hydrolase [Firmicutes bacterium]|nr:MBL fold metallo-hydrolase [Bacillota bacterium]